VNNAGVDTAYLPVEHAPLALWREMFETNLFGVVEVVRRAVPSLRAAGGGVVCNITSCSYLVGVPFYAAYRASKAAVGALGESLRAELAPFGIRVLEVMPGRSTPTCSPRPTAARGAPSIAGYEALAQALLGPARGRADDRLRPRSRRARSPTRSSTTRARCASRAIRSARASSKPGARTATKSSSRDDHGLARDLVESRGARRSDGREPSCRRGRRGQERFGTVAVRIMSAINTTCFALSGGRIGNKFTGGAPVCLVTTTGARSGARRTTPLIYLADGPNVVIVASKGGMSHHPAWYHNLVDAPGGARADRQRGARDDRAARDRRERARRCGRASSRSIATTTTTRRAPTATSRS
jgi:deazaflavin-dependent oxidoreductase (nitroreductase family)